MRDQTEVFCASEADGWFERNRSPREINAGLEGATPADVVFILDFLRPFSEQINTVLEIGCSNGRKLERLCWTLEAQGQGVDPSAAAVEDGNARLSGMQVHLTQGVADRLPFADGAFDFVFFGFCLYVVDRARLMATLAEADRVLKKGGFLAITDFDPGSRRKRPYAHVRGLHSYKQDYSRCFTDMGLYYLAAKTSFSHRNAFFDRDADERVCVSILYKEHDPYPLLQEALGEA